MKISIVELLNGGTHLVQSPFSFTLLYFNNVENHERIILCISIFLSSTSGTCTRTFSPTLAVTNFSFDSRSILLACFVRFYLAMVRFVRNDISSFSSDSFLIIDHINDHLLLTMQPSVASSVFWLSRYEWVLPTLFLYSNLWPVLQATIWTLIDALIWHY